MTTDIRKLLAQERRVETGPIQFGEDWPGVFIRGDNAAYYALALGEALHELPADSRNQFCMGEVLRGLQGLLTSAVARKEQGATGHAPESRIAAGGLQGGDCITGGSNP